MRRLIWVGLVGSALCGFACGSEGSQDDDEIAVATTVAGLACVAWTPVQSGTVTIAENHFAVVSDGDFFNPFPVEDGYAIKILHDSPNCVVEELRMFAHAYQGGPDVELTPLRFAAMPDGNRIWAYKPNNTSAAVNIADKIKGPPGGVCHYMTMTCTTD